MFKIIESENILTVIPTCSIDMTTIKTLKTEINNIINTKTFTTFIFDFNEVKHIDNACIGFILYVYYKMLKDKILFELHNPQLSVYRAFILSGLNKIIKIKR